MTGIRRSLSDDLLKFIAVGWVLVAASSVHAEPVARAVHTLQEIDSPAALEVFETRVREVALKMRPTVVALVITSESGAEVGSGSGTIISADGWVLTAGHVGQQPGKKVKVLLADGTELPGITAGQHFGPDGDVGLVKINAAGRVFPFANMGSTATLTTNEPIIAFGHPLGPERTPWRPPPLRVGRILAREGWQLAIDAPLSPGDSGGPVFRLDGTLVGVNSTASSRAELNTAATIECAQARMESMREGLASGLYLKDPAKDPTVVAQEDRSGSSDHEPGKGDDADPAQAKFMSVQSEQAERRAGLLGALTALNDPYADSVVNIIVDSRDACFGTVIDDDGHVLTKASELGSGARHIDVLLSDGLSVRGTRLAEDSALDLAILGTSIRDVTPVNFDATAEPKLGDAIISVGRGMSPLAVGHRSLDAYVSGRSDNASRALLGVAMRAPTPEESAKIPGGIAQVVTTVMPDSGAALAGIAVNDVVMRIDGVPLLSAESAALPLGARAPGDEVIVDWMHEGEVRSSKIRLLRPPWYEQRRALSVGTDLSRRATGFGEVIAHDSVVPAQQVGGPVLDSKGRVVGLNISRADRMKTYALASSRVKASVDAMLKRIAAGEVLPVVDPASAVATIQFAADGFARLGVSSGRVLGPTNALRTENGVATVVGWGDADDMVAWKLQLPAPGRYDISLECQEASGGKIDIFFGDDLLTATLHQVKNGKLRVGESVSTEAGEILIRVQPLGRPTGPVMKLQGVLVQRTDQLRLAEAAWPLLRWKDVARYQREWEREQRRKERGSLGK